MGNLLSLTSSIGRLTDNHSRRHSMEKLHSFTVQVRRIGMRLSFTARKVARPQLRLFTAQRIGVNLHQRPHQMEMEILIVITPPVSIQHISMMEIHN